MCSISFAVFALQPPLWASYGSAPDYPRDLARLNSLAASDVKWAGVPNVVEASWSEVDREFVSSRVERATLVVVGSTPSDPILQRTSTGAPVPINATGSSVEFRVPAGFGHIGIRVLLGNPTYGRPGGPELPIFSLAARRGAPHPMPLTIDTQATSARGWFFVMLNDDSIAPGDRYVLDIHDPRESGWLWEGGGSNQVGASRAEFLSRRWMEVWSVATPAGEQVVVLNDGTLEISRPLLDVAQLDPSTIDLPAATFEQLPDVFVDVDVVSNPWWRSSVLVVATTAVAFFFLPILFGAGAWFVAKWGWTGTLKR
jgi:hypothetical protein